MFLEIENELRSEGYMNIACIDEVGRGCLAGEVISCAIIMPEGIVIEGVNDSKKLTAKKRETLYSIILEKCIGYGIGIVDNQVIDKINIKNATLLSMKKAAANIKTRNNIIIKPDFLLIDAEKIDMKIPQKGIVKGDSRSHGIAAASIIAKVFRDRRMKKLHESYPRYGFDKNMGYGTKEHIDSIKRYGVTKIHRKSFLKKILDENHQQSFF